MDFASCDFVSPQELAVILPRQVGQISRSHLRRILLALAIEIDVIAGQDRRSMWKKPASFGKSIPSLVGQWLVSRNELPAH